ncbi:MAG TPA: response regulator [Thermoanaerobaculia bacterium]|nr:response regulator [Thermoanaerobaculia bacterium]
MRLKSDGPILLVEDNPDDVALTLRALRKNRIANEVVAAKDGVEAIEYLEQARRGEKSFPAIVLLDLNLPRIGGLEVLRNIRGDGPTRFVPVVILASSREERDMIEGYDLGANSFVQKPVDFDEFVDAVREVGVYWLLVNEPPPRSVT